MGGIRDDVVAKEKVPQGRNGVHIGTHTIFSSGGLQVAAYCRRHIVDGEPSDAIKYCLKLTAVPRYGPREYGAFSDGKGVSMEIEKDAMLGLHGVLAGRVAIFERTINRPASVAKTLVAKCQIGASATPPFFISLKEGDLAIGVSLMWYDSLAIQMLIAATLEKVFPYVDARTAYAEHLRVACQKANSEQKAVAK